MWLDHTSALESNEYEGHTIRKISKASQIHEKEESKFSINLPCIKGTSEQVRRSLSTQMYKGHIYSLGTLKKDRSTWESESGIQDTR